MKILIDIGHPAHVHYFKNFIKMMQSKEHQFMITARDKEVSQQLLKANGIDFISRGKGSDSVFGKIMYMLKADWLLFKYSSKFKPDIYMSFGSPYAAQVAWLKRKPHIVFDDTENAILGRKFYLPFSDVVLTPDCFKLDLGKKQIRFKGYMELCYLHPNWIEKSPVSIDDLPIKDEKYAILRFVSWNANHDIGHKGFSEKNKKRIADLLSQHLKVYITSEKKLSPDLEKYQIKIRPDQMHSVLKNASMLFGESATMASESAVLGIPSIYIDNVGRGYTDEEESKYSLVYNFTESEADQELAIQKAAEVISNNEIIANAKKAQEALLADKIDVTKFMVWFVENFPESKTIMRSNPDYQLNFK